MMFTERRTLHALRIGTALVALFVTGRAAPLGAAPSFDVDVAPLLAKRCAACHNAGELKGKLDLTSEAAVRAGGESGGVIVPGKPDESLLWQHVAADEMPPKKPLSPTEKQTLRAWIEAGAEWGKAKVDPLAYTTESRAGYDWWSLQPIRRPRLPADDGWSREPLDRFVAEKLVARQLAPSPPAERRVLIRRVTYDLTGLPPTPEEVAEFERDPSPDAYERLVDRLLASPALGERWARHWLDVVRYTESQGFEYDRLRPNAWHYRDYVVAAFNRDLPYDQFLREQIAGDVLEPVTTDGIVATSLLVCGPWDQAGNGQANVAQRLLTREEELEDLIGTVSQTFLGLTMNCARCHDHKFDPISQSEYYRFKSIFDGVRHGERNVASPHAVRRREQDVARIEAERSQLAAPLARWEQVARERLAAQQAPQRAADRRVPSPATPRPTPHAAWTFDEDARDTIGALHGTLVGGARIAGGRLIVRGSGQHLRTAPLAKNIRDKTLAAWVVLPTLQQGGGGVISLEDSRGVNFDAIVFAERQPRKWMAGSTGFQRTLDLDAPLETAGPGELVHMTIVYSADNAITLYRNGQPYAKPYTPATPLATYVAGDARVLLGCRHTNGGNPYLVGEIEAAELFDRALSAAEVAALAAEGGRFPTRAQLLATLSSTERQEFDDLTRRRERLERELAALPSAASFLSYCGVRQQPSPTRRLPRGNVRTPAEVVTPGGLSAVTTVASDFQLHADSPEAERRIRLARWLADPRHPLPARVMVNRLWHYHFGQGLVGTPSDFGFSGERPTHPELLDVLAAELVERSWSLKTLHRQMVLSATYRQASTFRAPPAALDADNQLLWRYSPRRLEGEVVRDAMLLASGELNRALGGPSFQPFHVTRHGSEFYHLEDKLGAEFNRRTLYRVHVNSGKSPLLDALDCPDPAVKAPRRRVTVTPLQALGMMNNSFVLRQAERLASRVQRESNGDRPRAIDAAYRHAFSRAPTPAESTAAEQHAREHGLANLCWVLLNTTEFLYVE